MRYRLYNKQKTRNKKRLILAIISITVISLPAFLYFTRNKSQQAEAAWWNDSWLYRKSITITNGSGSNLTDFQVKILDNKDLSADVTAGKIQADLDDLRFTDVNGILLPFFIEDSTNASVDAWVKMPSVPTAGVTVYMYYGNAQATSETSAKDTFVREIPNLVGFWDHAITASYPGSGNIWYDLSGNGRNFTNNSTANWSLANGFTIDGSTNYFNGPSSSVFPQGANPRTVVATANPSSWAGSYNHVFHYGTQSQYQSFGITSQNGTVSSHTWSSSCAGGSWTIGSDNQIAITGVGSLQEIFKNGSSIANCSSYNLNTGGGSNSQIGTRIGPAETWIGTIKNIQIYSRVLSSVEISDLYNNRAYAATTYPGKTLVRKYVATDPTAGTPGTEEKGGAPIAYWSYDEGTGTTAYDKSANRKNGTLTNMSSTPDPNSGWQTEDKCVSGKCLAFDGTNDYTTTGSITLGGTASGGGSVFLWVRHIGSSNIFAVGSWHNRLFGNNWTIIDANNVYHYLTVGNTGDGNWHYVGYTINGRVIKSYKDGVLMQTDTASYDIPDRSGSITIGQLYSGTGPWYYKGFVDEPKIYNYPRTEGQIKNDYNAGMAGMSKNQEGIGASLGDKSDNWLSNGLIGHWKMDESSWNGTSGEVIDSSGGSNNGTAYYSATTAAGKFGNGGSFPGSGSYVSVPSITGNSSVQTVSAWVYVVGAVSGNQYVFDQGGNNNWIQVYNSHFRAGTSGGYYCDGVTTVTTNTWYHVVKVFDGSQVKVYLNGVLDCLASATANTPGAIMIGNYSSGGYSLNGKIDDLRLYNRALSPQEVQQLFFYAPGPVGYWNFDDATGSTAKDLSGGGNNGSFTGTPTWTKGKYGGAISLPGSNNYVQIPFTNISSNYTIEGWVNLNSIPSGSDPNRAGGLMGGNACNNSGNVEFIFGNSSSTPQLGLGRCGDFSTIFGNKSFSLNTWVFVAATVDSNKNIQYYINGVNAGTGSGGANDLSIKTPIVLGSNALRNFNGQIDEVRIYNYVRTSKQILEDMNGGHPLGGSPVGSQMAYLKFDEGQGTTAYDSSPNHYNGSLIDGPTWYNGGKFGKALDLDGLNDRVQGFTSDPFEYTGGDMSLSIWINQDVGETGQGLIISKPWSGNGEYNYTLSIGSNDTLSFGLLGATSWGTSTSDTVSTGVWTHLVVTVNGSTKMVKIYKNGALIKTATHNISSWVPTWGDSNVTLCLGSLYPYGAGWGGNADFSFDGKIDDFKFYNGVLSDDEVKADYNQGKAMILGSKGTEADGKTPSNSDSRAYCVPGDTTSGCNPPIAEWKLDEGTGATANDSSGNGITGTLNSGQLWTRGKNGKAVDFNGTNDFINTTFSATTKNNYTIEGWFYDTKNNASYRSMVQYNSASDGALYVYPSNVIGLYPCSTGNVAFPSNQWVHVAATYDSGNSSVKYYINGRPAGSGSTCAGGANWEYLRLGGISSGDGERWKGSMDDVKIFDYARTPAQIAWDYNRGKPVGWWKMDEGQGTTAYDYSGNGNNGTLNNMDPPTDWVAGKNNGALDLDGSNDFISIPNNATLNMKGDFSISAWVYPKSIGGNAQRIIDTATDGTSTGQQYCLKLGTSSPYTDISGFVIKGGTSYETKSNTGYITQNQWQHVVYVYNSTTGYGSIYYNGQEVSYANRQTVTGSPDTLTQNVNIGLLHYNASYLYGNQKIDDVRIYNYALTLEQVKQVMNDGAVNFR